MTGDCYFSGPLVATLAKKPTIRTVDLIGAYPLAMLEMKTNYLQWACNHIECLRLTESSLDFYTRTCANGIIRFDSLVELRLSYKSAYGDGLDIDLPRLERLSIDLDSTPTNHFLSWITNTTLINLQGNIVFFSLLVLSLGYCRIELYVSSRLPASDRIRAWLKVLVYRVIKFSKKLHQLTFDCDVLPANILAVAQANSHLQILEFFGKSETTLQVGVYPCIEHLGLRIDSEDEPKESKQLTFNGGISWERLTDFPNISSLALICEVPFTSLIFPKLHSFKNISCLDLSVGWAKATKTLEFVDRILPVFERLTALTLHSIWFDDDPAFLTHCATWPLMELRIFSESRLTNTLLVKQALQKNPNLLYSNLCQAHFEPRRRHRLHWTATLVILAFVRANKGHSFVYSILPLALPIVQLAHGADTSTRSFFPRMLRQTDPLDTWHRPFFPMPTLIKSSDFLATRFAHHIVDPPCIYKRKRRFL